MLRSSQAEQIPDFVTRDTVETAESEAAEVKRKSEQRAVLDNGPAASEVLKTAQPLMLRDQEVRDRAYGYFGRESPASCLSCLANLRSLPGTQVDTERIRKKYDDEDDDDDDSDLDSSSDEDDDDEEARLSCALLLHRCIIASAFCCRNCCKGSLNGSKPSGRRSNLEAQPRVPHTRSFVSASVSIRGLGP